LTGGAGLESFENDIGDPLGGENVSAYDGSFV